MLKALPVAPSPIEMVLDWRGMLGRPPVVVSEH
jgi:hypothetical protein